MIGIHSPAWQRYATDMATLAIPLSHESHGSSMCHRASTWRLQAVASRPTVLICCLLLAGCGQKTRDDAGRTTDDSGPKAAAVTDPGPPVTAADEIASESPPAAPKPDDHLADEGPAAETTFSDELNGLAVKIELPGHSDSPAINVDEPFQVVLNNTSDQPIAIWTQTTKNGYYRFAFRFRNLQTGKIHVARRRPIDDAGFWKRRDDGGEPEPMTVEIAPHDSFATKVRFSDFAWGHHDWTGLPGPNSEDRFAVFVQFDSRNAADAPRPVWTGRLLSKPVTTRFIAPRFKTPHEYFWNGYPDAAIAVMSADPKWIAKVDDDSCTPLHHAARFGPPEAVKWLLDHDADVNAIAYNGFTPLHLTDDPLIVELILQKRPNLSIRCRIRGQTPLQRAVEHLVDDRRAGERGKWRRIVDLYRKGGADYDILTAIHRDDFAHVKQILKENPEFADAFQRESPLRTAARLGRLEICRYLIESHHVDVDDFERGAGYPIIKGALAYPRVVELLLKHGADLETRITWRGGRTGVWIIGDDATALHYAAAHGVPETVTMLIDHGVDIFATTRDVFRKAMEQTALDAAAFFGKADNAAAIVNHPRFNAADPQLRQELLDRCLRTGVSPSWLARDAQRPRLVEVLLDKGANPNSRENGITPMQIAANQIHPTHPDENAEIRRIVSLLAARGAPIDLFSAVAIGDEARVTELLKTDPKLAKSRGPDGYPALHFAVGTNNIKIVSALLSAGGEVDIRNKSDHTGSADGTALHCAAFWGRYEIAELLIAAGADVNALADRNVTPLDEALRLDNSRVAQLLRDHGAHEGKEK